MRILDLHNGKISKIFTGLLENSEDDITVFKLIDQNKKMIIGDHKGGLRQFTVETGEKINNLKGHSNEISAFKVDHANQLYVSGSWDSNLIIQSKTKNSFEIKREISNCFYNREINLIEISVYHNIIVMSSNSKEVYFWDYEYCKILGIIELEEGEESTCFTFINGFGLIFIGTNKSKVYLIKFKIKESVSEFEILTVIELEINFKQKSSETLINSIPNKLIIDIFYNRYMKIPSECELYVSLMKGEVRRYDIISIFKIFDLQQIPHADARINYNAFRVVKTDFIDEIKKAKKEHFLLKNALEKNEINNICNLNKKLLTEFQAHKDPLTSLSIIEINSKNIITSSTDSYLKIWNQEGILLAASNINYPLPTKWLLEIDNKKRIRKNILFALKIVELIFKRLKFFFYGK